MDTYTAKESIARLAARQQGRVHCRQLRQLGILGATITFWTRNGYLTPVLPKVYAVGHAAPSREADLWAAILYAGPGAMLSHRTAGHWLGIVDRPPARIEVSTPRKIASTATVQVHGRRQLDRTTHRGLQLTTAVQTMLDIAATAPERVLARALAQLDFRRELDLDALTASCGKGRPGSAALRAALAAHEPRLALTNGRLEEDFLDAVRARGLPLPRLNVWIDKIQVDAYWPEHRLVVELDGAGNHATLAQLRRDRANELTLRQSGLTVLRYDWGQVHGATAPALAELTTRLSRRSPS